MRGIRIIIIGVLYIIFMLWGCPAWLHHNEWYVAFLHHFFHANLFHLAVNCYSLWHLYRARHGVSKMPIAYLCATASWFFASADPVGASNFIFAFIGLCSPPLNHMWWRKRPTIIFLILNIAMLLLPQVSAITHIVSFALGCICACIGRRIKSLSRDIGYR